MKLNIIRTGPLEHQYPDIFDVVSALFPDYSIAPGDWSPEVDGIRLEWLYNGIWSDRHPIALRLSFRSAADYKTWWRSVAIKDGAIDERKVQAKHAELVALKQEHDAYGATVRAKRVEADERLRDLRAKVGDCALAFIYSDDRYELHTPPLTEAQVIRIAEAVKGILEGRE